jgi:soluble lytic murein transglycosylase
MRCFPSVYDLKTILSAFLFALLLCCVFEPAQASSRTEALKALAREDWAEARRLTLETKDPVLGKIYEWMMYSERDTVTGLPFSRIAQFMAQNPHWPDQDRMRITAERNMTTNDINANLALYFQKNPPLTGEGIVAYAALLKQQGQDAQIATMINQAWPKASMSSNTQSEILRSYGRLIAEPTQRKRIDALLFEDQNSLARALAQNLGEAYLRLVEARIALRAGNGSAVASVPASLQNDAGLLFERLRNRRKNDQDQGALEILNRAPPPASITNAEDWWKERNILVRRYIERRDFRTAYQIAATHGAMEGQELADAEWMAGWLALRFLNRPELALSHFSKMYNEVKSAISKARASYWAGRATEAMGQKEQATQWFVYAASFPKVYYGQLAAKHLGVAFRAPEPVVAQASEADRRKVQQSDLGLAIRYTHEAGLRETRNRLIRALDKALQTGGEYKALGEMLTRMGLPQEALKIAKSAAQKNFFLPQEAYPSLRNAFRSINVDQALAHGLIRQESQFDVDVRSPAGALGLMQLMPRTAEEVARKRGWDHQTAWLTSRPEHNILLGSAFLNELINRYDGAYPMALAAYNAGPSRVNAWIKEFGDPRKGQVDWIDWIELIPIYETRNYVQRVSESYVVYRDHLNFPTK